MNTVLKIALSGRTIFAVHTMKHTFAFQVYSMLILYLDIDEGNWLALRSARFSPTIKSLGTH